MIYMILYDILYLCTEDKIMMKLFARNKEIRIHKWPK
jgi:hypothetical protein